MAFIFPGQGSQQVGMGKDLCRRYQTARETFEEANDVLGFDLQGMCFKGPATDLVQTENTQPAILACSVATLRVLEDNDLFPDVVAGHSVGEYAALVAAGAISFSQALETVRLRGKLMSAVSTPGAMTAIVGLSREVLGNICSRASACGSVNIALHNSPIQQVIAGEAGAVAQAGELAREAGALKVVPLPVSQAFHSELMREMDEEFGRHIDSLELSKPQIPVVLNCTAMFTNDADEIRKDLKIQCTHAVHWCESIKQMAAINIKACVEVGFGRTLMGLNRSIDRNLPTWTTEKPEAIDKFVKASAVVLGKQVS